MERTFTHGSMARPWIGLCASIGGKKQRPADSPSGFELCEKILHRHAVGTRMMNLHPDIDNAVRWNAANQVQKALPGNSSESKVRRLKALT